MKNTVKIMLLAVIVVSMIIGMVGCGGGNDPKSLAKQYVELSQESLKMLNSGVSPTDSKFADLSKKLSAVGMKVNELSDADRKIYSEEQARLLTELDKSKK